MTSSRVVLRAVAAVLAAGVLGCGAGRTADGEATAGGVARESVETVCDLLDVPATAASLGMVEYEVLEDEDLSAAEAQCFFQSPTMIIGPDNPYWAYPGYLLAVQRYGSDAEALDAVTSWGRRTVELIPGAELIRAETMQGGRQVIVGKVAGQPLRVFLSAFPASTQQADLLYADAFTRLLRCVGSARPTGIERRSQILDTSSASEDHGPACDAARVRDSAKATRGN